MKPVTITYLEMTSPASLSPKPAPDGLSLSECRVRQYPLNRFLYQFIGGPWHWTDNLPWSDDEWKTYVERDDLRTWIAWCDGAVAGYYELERQADGNVEIAYFGLAQDFIGRGFGGYLLTRAIESAWEWDGTRRVWVHTCTLDHPSALNNYLSRGMQIYKKEIEEPN